MYGVSRTPLQCERHSEPRAQQASQSCSLKKLQLHVLFKKEITLQAHIICGTHVPRTNRRRLVPKWKVSAVFMWAAMWSWTCAVVHRHRTVRVRKVQSFKFLRFAHVDPVGVVVWGDWTARWSKMQVPVAFGGGTATDSWDLPLTNSCQIPVDDNIWDTWWAKLVRFVSVSDLSDWKGGQVAIPLSQGAGRRSNTWPAPNMHVDHCLIFFPLAHVSGSTAGRVACHLPLTVYDTSQCYS